MSEQKVTMKQISRIQFEKWAEFTKGNGRSGIDTKAMQEVNNGYGKLIKHFAIEIEASKLMKKQPDLTL